MKDGTVHGFRSTFSTWANELGIAKPDAIEAALAHREADAVRRAYNRSEFIAERRALMVAWSAYLAGQPWEAVRCLRRALWSIEGMGTPSARYRFSIDVRNAVLNELEAVERRFPDWQRLEAQYGRKFRR